MTIEEIVAEMDKVIAGAETEKRSLTDEEVTRYEALEGDLATARKTAEVRSRHTAYKTPITSDIITAESKQDEELDRAFDNYLRTGQANADLVHLRAQGEGTPAAGGYTVPTSFRTKLIERMKAFGGILDVVENITTETGQTLPWPTIDDTANVGEIVAEHGTGAAGADLVFGTADLGAYKYMSFGAGNLPLRVSVELLQDSAFDVQGLVSRLLGTRIRRAMAVHAVSGNGTTQPQGIATGAGGFNLTTGGTITYANLLSAMHTVDPEYRTGARWAMNDTALAAIQTLVDSTGRPLLVNGTAGIEEAPGDRLLGFPITIDQAFSNNSGDDVIWAVFGNLREAYVWRTVRDIQLVVDPYTRAANGEVQFIAWARADGAIQNANAYVKVRTQNV